MSHAIKLYNRILSIGTNLEYQGNLTDTVLDSIELGAYTLSFHLGTSRNYTRKRVDMEDLVNCMGLITRFPTIVFSILPSMYNLCGSRKTLAWNGNVLQDEQTAHIVRELEYELYTLSKLGGNVIVELGSYRGKDYGLEAVIKSINTLKFKLGYKLVLMNSLDQYFNVGVGLSDLKRVMVGVDKHAKQYMSVGFHLAYLFVNGLYELSNLDEMKRLFKDYDEMFKEMKCYLSVVVVSDCKNAFGAKEYEYAPIGSGSMWSSEVLYVLLDECRLRNVPILTETIQDAELLRQMGQELI